MTSNKLLWIFFLFSLSRILMAENVSRPNTEKYSKMARNSSESENKEMLPNPTTNKDWDIGFSANFDSGYRKTNFYRSNHDTFLSQWDNRIEIWLPPGPNKFKWGTYIRLAGLASNRSYAWENAWLAKPGYGFQVYPFSLPEYEKENNLYGKIFGPVRLFGEYNRLDYWGDENTWRPDEQTRAGLEYWKEINANVPSEQFWSEIWAGLFWQSTNEFDKDYDTPIFAYAVRLGVREPDADIISNFTPYFILESSLTDNDTYYWENRLLGGAGIRFAPFIDKQKGLLTRFVIFAEYLNAMDYYHKSAPSSVPDHDFRIGISFNIGEWYK